MPATKNATISLRINGQTISVAPRTTVAAALALAGVPYSRRSVGNTPRAPFCGMGVCQECRVQINGQDHQLACMQVCLPDMDVRTEQP